jgi:fused signal recognition particle receptor
LGYLNSIAHDPKNTGGDIMSIFDKLKQGLTKTRNVVTEQVNNVFSVFVRVDEELFENLEEALIIADLGMETSVLLIDELRDRVKRKHITDGNLVKQELYSVISDTLCEVNSEMNLNTTPSVILVIGVNGVGKTTSIGKIASYYKSQGKNVLLAAADTFRAAAIDQLDVWAERSGCDIIKHNEGSDPASVVFDACNAAKARGTDILICDTAGRLHNKKNLMAELEKINRIISRELPDADRENLLVLDATTGQNAVSQAKLFSEAADLTGIVLTKLDGTAKGGIVISIAKEQQLPVKFIGVGEGVDDLQIFSPEDFARALFDK